MKTILNLKILTVVVFLIIIIPGPHVSLFNFIIIPFIFLQFFLMIGIDPIDLESIKELTISILIISSLFLMFRNNKYFVLFSILVQYLFSLYTFQTKYLDYWYFTLSTLVYFILSIILIYVLFIKKV